MPIVSDRDLKCTTHFWKSFQKAMGTQLTMSTTLDGWLVGVDHKSLRGHVASMFPIF